MMKSTLHDTIELTMKLGDVRLKSNWAQLVRGVAGDDPVWATGKIVETLRLCDKTVADLDRDVADLQKRRKLRAAVEAGKQREVEWKAANAQKESLAIKINADAESLRALSDRCDLLFQAHIHGVSAEQDLAQMGSRDYDDGADYDYSDDEG